ncbi:MAG: apolipoprotein N-acyltransferase [Nitrospiraceae bacterium]|nr:MAG: apolipoprotein N-acyltransferase [Nitrospiraceae bacterium]
MVKKTDIMLSLFSGLLLVLSFPPFDYYMLAWTALVPLLTAIWEKNTKASFLLGALAGFAYFLGTLYWVFHSMYYYGYIPMPFSILMVILLCLYLALYTGIFSVLFNYISRSSGLPALFIAPVLWVSLEYLRTYALTGFPWSSLGYSQYRFLFLVQAADVTGVYGISFLVAATNSAVFDVLVSWPRRLRKEPLYARWPLTLGLLLYAVIIISALLYGYGSLQKTAGGQTIKVSVAQGNIPQDKKWDAKFQREVIDTYKRLSLAVSANSPELVVWPETAVPFIFGYDNALTQDIIAFQKQLGAYLLLGGMTPKDRERLSNSAVLLSPDGGILSAYDKIHLVPYGEYVPLRRFFPFIEKITVGIGDFSAGKEYIVMQTPFAKIGNLICYEIIFPGLVREFVDRGANVLVTITNDAWFGRTSAPYQHFSMAVFRAVENRVPVVRAANTGISGFIDSRGRIINKSDIFVEAALTEEISVGNEKSFYTKYGDLFAWFCIGCSVLLFTGRLFSAKRTL